MARDAATYIEHCVRSIYSPSGAASLATVAVPHSAMNVGKAFGGRVETREWNCGRQCEMWGVPLVCLFHNPSIVAPFELGLGIHNPRFVARPFEVGFGTRNSRFVAWPSELGLGTRSGRFVTWPLDLGLGTRNARSTMINCSTVFAFHCFVLPCVPIKMQGVGLLHFTLRDLTIGYLTFLFLTLPCPVLTCSS